MEKTMQIKEAIKIHSALEKYQDDLYLGFARKFNEGADNVLKENLGNEFVHNCGRDIAGELVRNCFDTTSYNITVDQLASRILNFKYENEYDPLREQGSQEMIRKDVLAYHDFDTDLADALIQKANLNAIKRESADIQHRVEFDDEGKSNYERLFSVDREDDKETKKATIKYRNSMVYDIKEREDGSKTGKLKDDITGNNVDTETKPQNKNDFYSRSLQADHIQSWNAAKVNGRYVTEEGVEKLQDFWNSSDNLQMMEGAANQSKNDVRVCLVDGEIKYYDIKDGEYKELIKEHPDIDITYKATPEQLADAIISRWEMIDENKEGKNANKIKTLKEKGYLNEDGKVPKSVRKSLIKNIRHSQNVESKIILQNTDYKVVGKDALAQTFSKKSMGKMIAGQIVYYTAPPLIYEIRTILKDSTITIENALKKIGEAGKRIGKYVLSKLKDIFTNLVFNSLKKFVRSFMDILINLVKATVKKLLKMAKNLVVATVDAVRIIADKNATAAQKADSVVNLFAVTVTSCVIEVLFEILGDTLHIPEPFDDIIFGPLQILATVVCTNLTMLILKKLDLFDVKFGYKISNIRKLFEENRNEYNSKLELASSYTDERISIIIEQAKVDCKEIYNNLQSLDVKDQSARPTLEKLNEMFSMGIDFDKGWQKFIGIVG